MKIPRRLWPYIFLMFMAGLTFWITRQNRNKKSAPPPGPRTEQRKPERPAPVTDPAQHDGRRTTGDFNRYPERLQYSRHARCRMGCRHIDEAEVKAVLENGTVNLNKSDMRASPDPRYAVEGRTPDGQEVRIIVAQGGRSSTIVTVIDLGRNWRCNCD